MATATQRVQTSTKQAWDKTKARTKEWYAQVGEPAMNKATDSIGVETFWPTSLDRESDKAARILRSFCIDGFAVKDARDQDASDPMRFGEMQVKEIPTEVIRACKGLAIFTVVRTSFISSRTGGSGIIVAKQANGAWSPPSGILITALGVGFQAGADIYDCICVINSDDGMEGFTRARCTIGGQVSTAIGPLGVGVKLGTEVHKRQAPVWTYTKGRGLYAGVQVEGTVIVERRDENARFYGVEGVRNRDILAGEVRAPEGAVEVLWETLKAVQGEAYDESMLPPARNAPDDKESEIGREMEQKMEQNSR